MVAFVVHLGKALHGNILLLVTLLEVETLCASSTSKCKAGLLFGLLKMF